jgi:hypothetical protein
VLTDEPYVYPDLQNIVCPKSYVSPLGKAKYKARALDYFRYHVSLGVYDWILHMDEESTTDGESLRRCLEFIRYVSVTPPPPSPPPHPANVFPSE